MTIYKKRKDFISDAIKEIPANAALLDIGFVGEYDEPYLHYEILTHTLATTSITGIDITEAKIAKFKSLPRTQELIKNRTTTYSVESIYKTSFADNSFDCIFLLEVLEHLTNQDAALLEIARILKPGGKLVITYPNAASLDRVVRYFFARDPLAPDVITKIKGDEDHYNFPYPACLQPYLRTKNLSVTKLAYINYRFKGSDLLAPLLSRFRVTQKMSSYIGVIAEKI